ncbi:IS5 family transposase [Geodermatophilus sp. SYSU D00525]
MSLPASSPPPRLISDELWALGEPLIPPRPPAVHGRTGRPRASDRDVLEGIAFVLTTGIGWAELPAELGYGLGWTCWRRMHEWAEAGVFDRLHQAVLDRLGEQDRLDWSRASPDSVSLRAKRGCADRAQPHRPVQGRQQVPPARRPAGLPLNVLVSAANRHDSLFVEPILDGMPAIHRGDRGHPRRRPVKLHGDKGYDNPRVRRYLRRRGIAARIGRDPRARLGRHRWVVERALGWLLSNKRLALRHDRTAVSITVLARLAVTLICARRLPTNQCNDF